jgi:uncharacterized protein YndB with AHSA1/START domain
MNAPLIIEQIYDASICKVWHALTDKNDMKAWYFPQLINFEPIIGFEFTFSNDGSQYQKNWCVIKVEDGRMLAHSWTYIGYPGRSEVTFELFNQVGKTCVRLTHTGLDSFPAEAHFARHRFEEGWKQILGSNLKIHLSMNPE